MNQIKRITEIQNRKIINLSKGTHCSIEFKYENIDLTLKTKWLTSDGHLMKYDVMV